MSLHLKMKYTAEKNINKVPLYKQYTKIQLYTQHQKQNTPAHTKTQTMPHKTIARIRTKIQTKIRIHTKTQTKCSCTHTHTHIKCLYPHKSTKQTTIEPAQCCYVHTRPMATFWLWG